MDMIIFCQIMCLAHILKEHMPAATYVIERVKHKAHIFRQMRLAR